MENGLAEKVGYKVREDEARSNTCGVSETEVRNYAEGNQKVPPCIKELCRR